MYLASIIKTYTHNSRLLFLVPLIPNLPMPPTPVILREAEGEVAESTDMNEPTPSRRGGTVNKDR